jgi:hypothetical protein
MVFFVLWIQLYPGTCGAQEWNMKGIYQEAEMMSVNEVKSSAAFTRANAEERFLIERDRLRQNIVRVAYGKMNGLQKELDQIVDLFIQGLLPDVCGNRTTSYHKTELLRRFKGELLIHMAKSYRSKWFGRMYEDFYDYDCDGNCPKMARAEFRRNFLTGRLDEPDRKMIDEMQEIIEIIDGQIKKETGASGNFGYAGTYVQGFVHRFGMRRWY